MSRFLALIAFCILLAGCGKKPAPAPSPEPEVKVEPAKTGPEPVTPSERDLWIVDLKSTHREKRKDAIEALSILAETDEATRDALIELLRDKTTAGAGKTHPTQITSTREAAAAALLKAGAKGEAAIAEKGILPLREGLVDKDPAVREHTAHVIGTLGPVAKPLSGSLLKAASEDKVEQVRAIAFDSLRSVGVTDVATLAALLNRKEPADVKRRAAEIISVLPEFPMSAMASLIRALDDDDDVIRISAAIAIDTAGPKNATKDAPVYLVDAIKKTIPADVRRKPLSAGRSAVRVLLGVGETGEVRRAADDGTVEAQEPARAATRGADAWRDRQGCERSRRRDPRPVLRPGRGARSGRGPVSRRRRRV
ncbi:MAG: hypothetical protein U0791_15795 [Gemmataceae bacterium]